jgi:hypothetical protein
MPMTREEIMDLPAREVDMLFVQHALGWQRIANLVVPNGEGWATIVDAWFYLDRRTGKTHVIPTAHTPDFQLKENENLIVDAILRNNLCALMRKLPDLEIPPPPPTDPPGPEVGPTFVEQWKAGISADETFTANETAVSTTLQDALVRCALIFLGV